MFWEMFTATHTSKQEGHTVRYRMHSGCQQTTLPPENEVDECDYQ